MIRLLPGDCREVLATLPADSVHCVVTSPPYYGLRDYGTAQWAGGDAACDHRAAVGGSNGGLNSGLATAAERSDGTVRELSGPRASRQDATYRAICGKCGATRVGRQIGLEATPAEYLAEMVGVFREVRRVLRPDGTCWVNMGDSYAATKNLGYEAQRAAGRTTDDRTFRNKPISITGNGYKPKDLLMMPARLALALQADGWWLRSDIIWAKPNPMPESITDRPTSAHEHVFLLAKSARYFYDADAVRESAEYGYSPTPQMFDGIGTATSSPTRKLGAVQQGSGGSRNLRNVWTLSTHSFPGAHFATYPPALAERCIRAGTSERGCCAACGAPWGRVTDTPKIPTEMRNRDGTKMDYHTRRGGDGQKMQDWRDANPSTTTGWAASCACDAATVPCTVLDPFAGAGTTLLVADRLQRDAIGIELNPAYTEMAMARCRDDAPLFAEPSPPPAEDPEDARIRDLFAEPLAAD